MLRKSVLNRVYKDKCTHPRALARLVMFAVTVAIETVIIQLSFWYVST